MDLGGLKCSTKQLEFLPQLPLAIKGDIPQLQLQKHLRPASESTHADF